MSVITCLCGGTIEISTIPPPSSVTCICARRYIWARTLYVPEQPCREASCSKMARAYRNGYDETIFLCEDHERARWAYP